MVSILVGGKDKTATIANWSIWSKADEGLQLRCSYVNEGTAFYPLCDCNISPVRELDEMLLTKTGSTIATPIAKATIYGERYAVVYDKDAGKPYIYKVEDIAFAAPSAINDAPVFHYFKEVANAR